MLFAADRIVTPSGPTSGWIRVVGGLIAELGVDDPPGTPDLDLRGRGSLLGPGFIDLHVHGAGGADVMDGDVAGLRTMARALARCGVTAFLATTYTASEEETMRALAAIEVVRSTPADDGALVLGAHMEGPFLSVARRGAHDPALLRPASTATLAAYRAVTPIRIIVLAPELDGHLDIIRELAADGVLVALGHTDAREADMREGAEAGARLVTHLFNSMSPVHHREAGAAGAALDLAALTCEVIADGTHVAPAAIRLALAAKGIGGLVLVSDAGRDAGALGASGGIRLSDGTLASSLSLLDQGLRTFCDATGKQPDEAWPVVSGNAARMLDLPGKGVLRAGADADLTAVDGAGKVLATVVAGRVVYAA